MALINGNTLIDTSHNPSDNEPALATAPAKAGDQDSLSGDGARAVGVNRDTGQITLWQTAPGAVTIVSQR